MSFFIDHHPLADQPARLLSSCSPYGARASRRDLYEAQMSQHQSNAAEYRRLALEHQRQADIALATAYEQERQFREQQRINASQHYRQQLLYEAQLSASHYSPSSFRPVAVPSQQFAPHPCRPARDIRRRKTSRITSEDQLFVEFVRILADAEATAPHATQPKVRRNSEVFLFFMKLT